MMYISNVQNSGIRFFYIFSLMEENGPDSGIIEMSL